jgi:hypothetical protein
MRSAGCAQLGVRPVARHLSCGRIFCVQVDGAAKGRNGTSRTHPCCTYGAWQYCGLGIPCWTKVAACRGNNCLLKACCNTRPARVPVRVRRVVSRVVPTHTQTHTQPVAHVRSAPEGLPSHDPVLFALPRKNVGTCPHPPHFSFRAMIFRNSSREGHGRACPARARCRSARVAVLVLGTDRFRLGPPAMSSFVGVSVVVMLTGVKCQCLPFCLGGAQRGVSKGKYNYR